MDVDRTTWGSTLVKNHDENKTYFLVKLSESCSNAIQEYSEPKIKFHGSRGAIKFPNGKSYDFSLEQQDNTVECLRQTKNRWEAVGKVAFCLHVKGKDDVYQRTRTKMEAAEQEKRKNCTKLLGSPDSETPATISAKTASSSSTKLMATNNSSSASSYYSSSSSSSNFPTHNSNHSLTSRTSKSHLDTSANHKLSSSTLAPDSILNSSSLAATVQATTVAADIKSSLLSSISSASSSSSSASSSSAAPATNAMSNNSNINSQFNPSKYPDIADVKQMKRYKAEFDKDFKEYQHLHGYLQRIEERFKKLRDKLGQRVEGTKEWESAKEEIFVEYDRIKGDSNFHKKRGKYKQLHSKLAHLKEKIFQFKREHRDKFNGRKKRKR